MAKMSEYALIASILATGFAFLLYAFYAISGVRAARMQTAGGPNAGGTVGFMSGPRTGEVGRYASIFVWLAIVFLTASLTFRAIVTGHGPFANMYEFSAAFALGVLVSYAWFEHKYHQRILALIALPVALAMLLYAVTIPADIEPLVPALQNNLLLTVHVAVAIVAYGSFAIAFASSLLFLLQGRWVMVAAGMLIGTIPGAIVGGIMGASGDNAFTGVLAGLLAGAVVGGLIGGIARWSGVGASLADSEGGRWGLPKPQVLDEIGYRAVVVGFPFLTLTILLGAVWAETAWGSYWSWDPKETASLVTWFIYGAYLHARVMRGWRGDRAAWLLVLGFVAVLFTYFGNLFFGGLHSYSGLG
jgi:cytochrome c-type biogenesis protein CcsB